MSEGECEKSQAAVEQRSAQPEAGEASGGNAKELGARVCVCPSKPGRGWCCHEE